MIRIFLCTIFSVCLISPSFAHVGHLGEVASHAHWVGVAAIAGAAALGALVGKLKDKEEASSDDEPSEELEGEAA